MNKQAFGNIVKKEQLKSLSDSIDKDIMLLVASQPFPGYKGNFDKNYFYLVLDSSTNINTDELIQLTQNVIDSLPVKPDIFPCEITVYNKLYQAIRIYGEDYESIHKLISQFRIYGVKFQKYQVVKPYISQIKVTKYFELEKINEGIYKSTNTPEFKYIELTKKIGWEEFESLINKINYIEAYKNCDFAIATFHSKEGFDYYLRIFSESCTLDKLSGFRTLVLNILEQLSIK